MNNINQEELKVEMLPSLNDKTSIEKMIASDNIKLGEERSKYIGAEKDDILYSFTLEELEQPKTYELLEKKMSNSKAEKVFMRGKLYSKNILKIIKIAQKNNLSYIVLKNPEFQGDIGLVITKKNY